MHDLSYWDWSAAPKMMRWHQAEMRKEKQQKEKMRTEALPWQNGYRAIRRFHVYSSFTSNGKDQTSLKCRERAENKK
jgi:hypothetical protein